MKMYMAPAPPPSDSPVEDPKSVAEMGKELIRTADSLVLLARSMTWNQLVYRAKNAGNGLETSTRLYGPYRLVLPSVPFPVFNPLYYPGIILFDSMEGESIDIGGF